MHDWTLNLSIIICVIEQGDLLLKHHQPSVEKQPISQEKIFHYDELFIKKHCQYL